MIYSSKFIFIFLTIFFSVSLECFPQSNFEVVGSVRSLSELNKSDNAEAYPFISENGLNIYFTSGSPDASNIFVASRHDTSSPFSTPVLLSNHFPPGSHSGWLSKDELDIYFVNKNAVYTSRRNSIYEKFLQPVIVHLSGRVYDFVSSVSLTQDKEELLIYSVLNRKTNISVFRKQQNSFYDYAFVGMLPIPVFFKVGSGMLSSNGLGFYLSVRLNNRHKLAKLTRNTTKEVFTDFQILEGSLIDNLDNMIQPSVASDNFVAFVVNHSINWSDSDLYLYQKLSNKLDINQFSIELYPNPTTGKVNVTFNKSVGKLEAILISLDGVEQKRFRFNNAATDISLDIEDLNPGLYILKLKFADMTISKKVVKGSGEIRN
jgi:hypothetical protein